MRKTNRATQFSANLTAALREREAFGLEWEKNWNIRNTRETVDVVGLQNGRPRVLIEVELRRKNPSSNVIKIWQGIEEKRIQPARGALFVQAFSKVFYARKGKVRQRDLAGFAGRKMREEFPRIGYVQIPFPYNPSRGGLVGGGARKRQAVKLAEILLRDRDLRQALGTK